MKYAIKLLFDNKCYLRAVMIFPVLGFLAFTGCSGVHGTAEQQLSQNRLAAFVEQSHEKPQPADSKPNPGYQWFY
jgi:cytochrome b